MRAKFALKSPKRIEKCSACECLIPLCSIVHAVPHALGMCLSCIEFLFCFVLDVRSWLMAPEQTVRGKGIEDAHRLGEAMARGESKGR